MASWVIPNEGKQRWLDAALQSAGFSSAEDYDVKLYQNNYTPVDTSTTSNFTEATFTGYTLVTITHATFPAASISSNIAVSDAGNATFSCSGGASQTIYGCYVVGHTSGKVYAAVIFDASITVVSGLSISVDVKFQLKTFV